MTSTPEEMFAHRLREQRKSAKLTQAGLARLLSDLLGTTVNSTAVTKIEKGDRTVRLDEAVAAAQALGVPLATLVSEQTPESARLDELRKELAIQESRAHEAETEFKQAQFAIAQTQQAIDEYATVTQSEG